MEAFHRAMLCIVVSLLFLALATMCELAKGDSHVEATPPEKALGLQSEAAACVGKHPFNTYEAAQRVQRKQRKSRGSSKMAVYHCCYCGKYHLSNRTGSRKLC